MATKQDTINDELVRTVEAAQKIITDQDNALTRLTTLAPVHGIAVRVNKGVPHPHHRFVAIPPKGTRLRLRPDSEHYAELSDLGDMTSKGTSSGEGWVSVLFDYRSVGRERRLRWGSLKVDSGACDVMLLSDTVTVATENGIADAMAPEGLKVNPGDAVLVVKDTHQIISKTTRIKGRSLVAVVRNVLDADSVEIEVGGDARQVTSRGLTLAPGDKVIVDERLTFVLDKLGKEDNKQRWEPSGSDGLTWDDIGGLDEAKAQMVEAVELPHRFPDLFSKYGQRPVKGVLLYGPPGCGKTMLGKAAATALSKLKGTDAAFYYVKGPEILDRYVGVAEQAIRDLFARARTHKASVIFIDEADSLLGRRGSGISSDIERTIVPMFLTEMDGFDASGALVILATNRADILDPAITREGRIDRKVKITRPTLKSTEDIFGLNLKRAPLNNGYTHADLSKLGAESIFDPERKLDDGRRLSSIVSGGMVAAIAQRAVGFAMRRDIAANVKEPSGLKKEDLIAAIDAAHRENAALTHKEF